MKKYPLANLNDWSAKTVKNQRVLVRLDVNVPIKNGRVVSGFRLEKSWPTLAWLKKNGAKIIIIGHAPEGQSLKPISQYFKDRLAVIFADLSTAPDLVEELKPGQALWLENLRNDPGEKGNSLKFAKTLAKLGDLYVNEAFSASHRRHASIVKLPKLLPAVAGLRFLEEYQTLNQALKPASPFVCLIGGVKFSTKLPLIKKLSLTADSLFVGGAMVHTLFHRLGYPTGRSLLEISGRGLMAVLKRDNLVLPTDVVVLTKTGGRDIRVPEEVKISDTIYDAGPETLKRLEPIIKQAKFILWNGPIGNFETGFKGGTEKLAKLIAKSSAYTLVGGGDTIVTLEKLKLIEQMDFVSTGGGAMLDFLTQETLPGIEVLKQVKN